MSDLFSTHENMTHISYTRVRTSIFLAWYLEFLLTLFLMAELEVNQFQGDYPQPAAWQVKFRAMTNVVISEYIHKERRYCVIRFKCDEAPVSRLVGEARRGGR